MSATFFFTFNQNNSGGHFHESKHDGICEHVIIEAHDAKEANARAEEIGLYFDGCETGSDCECCGDRWFRVDDYDGNVEPLIYGNPAGECNDSYAIHYFHNFDTFNI